MGHLGNNVHARALAMECSNRGQVIWPRHKVARYPTDGTYLASIDYTSYVPPRPLDQLWGWSGPILSYGAPPTAVGRSRYVRRQTAVSCVSKTNVNNSLQRVWNRTGRRRGSPDAPKSREAGGAGRRACRMHLDSASCEHRLKITSYYDLPQMCRPIELISRPAGLSNTIFRQPQLGMSHFLQHIPLVYTVDHNRTVYCPIWDPTVSSPCTSDPTPVSVTAVTVQRVFNRCWLDFQYFQPFTSQVRLVRVVGLVG